MTELSTDLFLRKLDAEKNLAAAAFSKPDMVLDQCGYITADMFSDERYRRFWEGLRAGADSAQAALEVSPLFVLDIMRDSEAFAFAYDFSTLGNALAQEHWFYQTHQLQSELAKAMASGDLETARRITAEMGEGTPAAFKPVPHMGDIGLEFIEVLEGERKHSIPIGIAKLDQAFGGWWRGSLYVIAARPGVGKTAFLWQVARNAAAAGHKVLFASLEMSRLDLFARAACGAAGIPFRDVIAGRISNQQRAVINRHANTLMDLFAEKLYVDDTPRLTTTQLWNQVATLHPDLVATDHLRLFADYFPGEREDQRLGRISWGHKQIAKEFDIPVLAAAQLNRKIEERSDKAPMLSDLRDSGQIEENSDVVLGIHRQREYIDNKTDETPAEFYGLKFRNGPDIKVNLTFNGLRQWFGEKGVDDA